jgi:hypothetical protein
MSSDDATHVTASFEPIDAFARIMKTFPRPWYVAGGWAIDLFVGRVTRVHGDLEVGVFRCDQGALQAHMADWDLFKLIGPEPIPWSTGEYLELPLHQIVARRQDAASSEVEFFLNESVDGQWRFRRNQDIQRPEGEFGLLSGLGIPIVAPEIMLAYKARGLRPRDAHDFAIAAPLLSASQRAWLRWTLGICHPGHPWLARL